MIKPIQQPIFITGCARSGTSLVAGIINRCGAFGGKMSGPTHNNRKGMYENIRIRNEIIKPYLDQIGVDRLGQYPLPNVYDLFIHTSFKKHIENIMIMEGYNQKQRFFYKGAKMCLIWPILNLNFPKAQWIIVRRKTEDIIDSCIRTSFMRAFRKRENQKAIGVNTEREGWLWWVNQHLERFNEMMEANLNIHFVWPEKMIDKKDYSEIKEIIKYLDLKWNDEVYDFVTPELWRRKR